MVVKLEEKKHSIRLLLG